MLINTTLESYGYDSSLDVSRDYRTFYIIAAFYSFVCLITILGNVATIYAYYKERSLREKPSDLLVLNLSVADLGIGLLCMPFIISNHICNCWLTKEIGCRIWVILCDTFVFGGVATVIAISFDRFLLVHREYSSYLRIQNKSRIKVTIILCWLFSVIPNILDHSLWEYAKTLPNARVVDFRYNCLSPSREIFIVTLIISVIGSFIPLAIISSLSFSFICLLRVRLKKHRQVNIAIKPILNASEQVNMQRDSRSRDNKVGRSSTENNDTIRLTKVSSTNHYTKPAMTFISLIAAMGVCSLPYLLYMLTSFFCSQCYDPIVRGRLVSLVFFNSFLNPCMYAITQSKIRKFYLLKFRQLWRTMKPT
ncbi:5-hydroxytryptamine receptor 7-like [Amphiura filiformis]|uniref:5-hydroxytryptamine receptor 7-like n=1 Tax=Amphiura filiformis TaxID=82378 RepID=UPI003B21145E